MKYIRKKQQKMSLRKNPPEHIYKNIIFPFQQKKLPYPWHPPRTQTFYPFPICNSHTLTQSRVISFSEATPHIAIVSFSSLPILLT